jgi:hypothetical protein
MVYQQHAVVCCLHVMKRGHVLKFTVRNVGLIEQIEILCAHGYVASLSAVCVT